jgi:hypothetical protein
MSWPEIVTTPPPPLPASLEEYIDRHVRTFRMDGRPCEKAARFAGQLVTVAAEGGEPPSLAGLSGEDLATAEDVLSELVGRAGHEYPPATPLAIAAMRAYHERIEIVPHRLGQERGRPVARERFRPGPVFRAEPAGKAVVPAVLAAQLLDLAARGEAAARVLRALAAGLNDGSGEADTTSLDPGARAAVAALIETGRQASQAAGQQAHAQALSEVAGEWQLWSRTAQHGGEAKAAEPAAPAYAHA